jgi:hypothetical protein
MAVTAGCRGPTCYGGLLRVARAHVLWQVIAGCRGLCAMAGYCGAQGPMCYGRLLRGAGAHVPWQVTAGWRVMQWGRLLRSRGSCDVVGYCSVGGGVMCWADRRTSRAAGWVNVKRRGGLRLNRLSKTPPDV